MTAEYGFRRIVVSAVAQLVGQQAAVMSYEDGIRLIAIVAAVSIPLPFLLRRERGVART